MNGDCIVPVGPRTLSMKGSIKLINKSLTCEIIWREAAEVVNNEQEKSNRNQSRFFS